MWVLPTGSPPIMPWDHLDWTPTLPAAAPPPSAFMSPPWLTPPFAFMSLPWLTPLAAAPSVAPAERLRLVADTIGRGLLTKGEAWALPHKALVPPSLFERCFEHLSIPTGF